jgi:hypothetical protein
MATATALLCFTACAGVDDPSLDSEIQASRTDDPEAQPWIVNPPPAAGPQTWNCTFELNPACQKDYHPGNTCWERAAGHGGLVRQEIAGVHCVAVLGCPGNAPGDINLVRLCHPGGGGIMTPCGPTGPRGCAVCDPTFSPVCGT